MSIEIDCLGKEDNPRTEKPKLNILKQYNPYDQTMDTGHNGYKRRIK